jgi:glycosyltransferase involved in cell wall biosynthesis
VSKVFLICNTAWSLYHFRLPLIRALQGAGHDVVTVSPYDDFVPRLARQGVAHVVVPMNRKGTNPLEDLALAVRYHRLLRRHRPDVVLAYRAKPNIYASLAARPLRIPVVNTITGLGSAFMKPSPLTDVVGALYRMALRRSARVVFQNPDDLDYFVGRRLVDPGAVERIPGSGVDMQRFGLTGPLPPSDRFVFLLVARLLWDKGIGEYVEAARRLRGRGLPVEWRLLGYLDPGNPSAIPGEQVEAWSREGVVRYLGASEAVAEAMREAHCIVLPSYREGLPRTLLEGAAMGKPLIATDVPGCREVVLHGHNGLRCRPRDAADLADQMLAMLQLPEEARLEMGRRSHEKASREYDERLVIRRYLDLVTELARPPASDPYPEPAVAAGSAAARGSS